VIAATNDLNGRLTRFLLLSFLFSNRSTQFNYIYEGGLGFKLVLAPKTQERRRARAYL
jgi:hypothetical protein